MMANNNKLMPPQMGGIKMFAIDAISSFWCSTPAFAMNQASRKEENISANPYFLVRLIYRLKY
jgi:hypothetical protein